MEINCKPQLRHGAIDDIADLLPLMEQFGCPVTQDVLRARFQSFTQNSGYGIVVACIDDRPIGLVAWSRSQFFIYDKARFYIEILVVDKRYRRVGIGAQLVECVEDYARASGPSVVDLTSSMKREKDGAHAFYRKLGYKNEGEREKRYFRKNIS